MDRDTAGSFPKGQLAIEANSDLDTRSLERGGVYDSALVRASEESNAANILDRRDKERGEKMEEWMTTRKRIGIGSSETVKPTLIIRPLSKEQEEERAKTSNPAPRRIAELLEKKDNLSNQLHFSEILIRDEDFCGIAKVAIFGEAEKFFCELLINNLTEIIKLLLVSLIS